jgi:hypothetical protein
MRDKIPDSFTHPRRRNSFSHEKKIIINDTHIHIQIYQCAEQLVRKSTYSVTKSYENQYTINSIQALWLILHIKYFIIHSEVFLHTTDELILLKCEIFLQDPQYMCPRFSSLLDYMIKRLKLKKKIVHLIPS